VSSAIGVISKVRYKLDMKTAFLLYNTLILPHLNYCNIVWGSTYQSTHNRLFILQKRALKICTFRDNRVSTDELFKDCNKISLMNINKTQISKFVYSFINNLLPRCFNDFFKVSSHVHSHCTRNNNNNSLFAVFCKTNIRKRSVSVLGPVIWKSLSESVRNSCSLHIFLKRLKQCFL